MRSPRTSAVATGLSAYDLQAPAKNLYPIVTPLRNSLPRVARLNPGDAARWRTIASITGSGYDAMGWVPEGQRTASMSYAAQAQVAPYLTLGEEDTVTFEAEAAVAGLRRPQRHRDAAPAAEDDAQGGDRAARRQRLAGARHAGCSHAERPRARAPTLPPATYSVIVVALSFEGYRNSTARRRRRDLEDHHRQRRQHLYAERRLLEQERQRHPGGDARPDAERDRADRRRRRRLRLVRRRCRHRDAAGDHHDQQRDLRRAADHRTAGRER